MKPINFRKYAHVILWLALICTVALVCLFGGREELPKELPVTPSETVPDFLSGALPAPTVQETAARRELVGVWVPYMSLSTPEHTRAAFEENFRRILTSAKEKGVNALFVHVRPFCDALYPSALYPWSHILTGTQGEDPGFDPLDFMVDAAHKAGLELHAWINPLRIKTGETDIELAEDHPCKMLADEFPAYFMECDAGVYLNPAYSYVRSLIADGAAEIAEKYDVDGIHFDDYFYPTADEFIDSEAYAAYADSVETPISLSEWRTANISALVAEVYEKVKRADPDVVFGISPQGNIENDAGMGADVTAWCGAEGYIDYICPQLYYSFENEALGFGDALAQWAALEKHDTLQLYVGLALYKAGTDADGGTWKLSDTVIAEQIEAARAARCSGVILYSADYLDAEQTAAEMQNAAAVLAPVEGTESGAQYK